MGRQDTGFLEKMGGAGLASGSGAEAGGRSPVCAFSLFCSHQGQRMGTEAHPPPRHLSPQLSAFSGALQVPGMK